MNGRKSSSDANAKLIAQLDDLNPQLAQLEYALSNTKKKLVEEALIDANAESSTLHGEVENLMQALITAKEKHQKTLRGMDVLRQAFDKAETDVLESSNRLAGDLVKEHKNELSNLLAEIMSINQARKTLKDTRHTGYDDHGDYDSIHERHLREQITRKQEELENTKDDLQDARFALSKAKKKNLELTAGIEELIKGVFETSGGEKHKHIPPFLEDDDFDSTINQYLLNKLRLVEKKMKESSDSNEELIMQVQELTPHIRKLERDLLNTQEELETETSARRRAELAKVEAEVRAHDAEYSLDELKAESKGIYEELVMEKKEVEKTRIKLKIEGDQHQLKLKELKKKIADLRHQIAHLHEKNDNNSVSSDDGSLDSFSDIASYLSDELKYLITSGSRKAIANEFKALSRISTLQKEHNAQLLVRLLKLEGNIQVCCRVRPMTNEEIRQGAKKVVDLLSDSEVGVLNEKTKSWKSFSFDKVWGPDARQLDIFQDIEPLALSVVDGYNACIFAYGQT